MTVAGPIDRDAPPEGPARAAWLRALAIVVVVVLAAAGVLVGLGAAPVAAATADDEAELLAWTNHSRAASGIGPLAYDIAASAVARGWAQELARSGNLRHNPNLVGDIDRRVTSNWSRVGENVGYASSIAGVHGAYMNSAGHRANILGNYNRVGIGSARDGGGRVWTTVVFVLGPPLPVVSPAAFRPYASAPSLVAHQYQQVLGRPVDDGGLTGWTSQLLAGAPPAALVSTLLTSPEAQAVVAPVVRLYLAYFLRLPDPAGLDFWVSARRAGVSLAQVSAAFASSPEFVSRYGALGHQGFVELVYRNVLGRPADLGGLTYWATQLVSGGRDRGSVMLGFSESGENARATWARTTVAATYLGLLDRAPDAAGLAHWSSQLAAGRPLQPLVAAIWGSPEFQSRPR